MIVNDRVRFTNGTDPSFTDASLPPSGDTALSESRMYYVQSVPSVQVLLRLQNQHQLQVHLTFDSNGASVVFETIYLADIVRDAPVPVGGALKVIAGQKLVIESLTANVQDKLYLYVSAANACDAIASVLQEVS